MKILVTGGAGFIASNIVDAYVKEGYQVAVIDDLSSGRKEFINPKVKFFQEDIRNGNDIETIIKTVKPDIINHHAAQISVRNSVTDPIKDAQVNLLGLLHLLEPARKYGVKKIIFASSGGVVYGEADKIPTPESYLPLQPLSPYGVAKLASENYLYFYLRTYSINYIALRYSNVYGPRQNPHGEAGVVAIFSRKLLRGEPAVINGDGNQTRDYVYVGDVVNANLQAARTDINGAYNIGTGKETDVNEIYKGVASAVGADKEPIHGQAKPGEQKRSCLDNTLAGKALHWKPQVNLTRGLKQTVDYFRSHAE